MQLCFRLQAWKDMNNYLITLSKRRGQLKQAITSMVQEVISYLDQMPSKETKLELIQTLITITEGKVG